MSTITNLNPINCNAWFTKYTEFQINRISCVTFLYGACAVFVLSSYQKVVDGEYQCSRAFILIFLSFRKMEFKNNIACERRLISGCHWFGGTSDSRIYVSVHRLRITQLTLLYSWRFSRYSAPIHWLDHGHMTSNNETVSRQMPWACNIAKTMTSNGKQFTVTRETVHCYPPNVDRCCTWSLEFQRGFQILLLFCFAI